MEEIARATAEASVTASTVLKRSSPQRRESNDPQGARAVGWFAEVGETHPSRSSARAVRFAGAAIGRAGKVQSAGDALGSARKKSRLKTVRRKRTRTIKSVVRVLPW